MRISPVEKHFDEIAKNYDTYTKKRELHYSAIKDLLKNLIPPRKKILEVGCGTGNLLSYLDPKKGYGLDISHKMIEIAKRKHKKSKNLFFSTRWPGEKYNYIFMADVIEHLEDPQDILHKISKHMGSGSVFINIMMNPLWEPIEIIYEKLGRKMPEGPHKRLKYKEIVKLLDCLGLKVVAHDYKLLLPIEIPVATKFINKYFEKYFRRLAFIEYLVVVKR